MPYTFRGAEGEEFQIKLAAADEDLMQLIFWMVEFQL